MIVGLGPGPAEWMTPEAGQAIGAAPDVVGYPGDESDIAVVLDWARSADATVTPFGGGSSVCGGVEPRRGTHKGAVTIDLRRMGRRRQRERRDGADP